MYTAFRSWKAGRRQRWDAAPLSRRLAVLSLLWMVNVVMLNSGAYRLLSGFAGGFIAGVWIAVNVLIVSVTVDIIRVWRRMR